MKSVRDEHVIFVQGVALKDSRAVIRGIIRQFEPGPRRFGLTHICGPIQALRFLVLKRYDGCFNVYLMSGTILLELRNTIATLKNGYVQTNARQRLLVDFASISKMILLVHDKYRPERAKKACHLSETR